MAHQGFGGVLDTPRSNVGDATYLGRQPDFADISQEASFLSPEKDGDLLQQLRNGHSNGINLRTPRQRGPLADRRNLPSNIGGAEFTPLLKSATRNGMRKNGKENNTAVATPAALRRLLEEDDMTPLPRMDASVYSQRNVSFLDNDLPQFEASSATSTPMGLPPRRDADKGPLQDGNQLSLREQENVIDKIEKENFGLKLKIHFLEEALRKAGPGFSEAALKENTELKVDKVTMQRELQRYKKHITTAERDLESYRQQMLELQEKAKKKYANENQEAELDTLRQTLQERESDLDELQRQVSEGQDHQDKLQKLQDNVEDLEAELREKERIMTEREDELEDLREKLDEAENKARELEQNATEYDANQHHEVMEDALATIRDLEQKVRNREDELEDLREKLDEAENKARELEQNATEHDANQHHEVMEDALATIRDLEQKVRNREDEVEEMKVKMNSAFKARELEQNATEHNANQHQEVMEEALATIRHLQQKVRNREDEVEEMKEKMNSAFKARELEQNATEHDVNVHQVVMEDALATIRDLEQKVRNREDEVKEMKEKMNSAFKARELEQNATEHDANVHQVVMEDALATIRDLEQKVRNREDKVEEMKEKMNSALSQKGKAEEALDELQEEMANKSIMTKGLSRQIEEKVSRLQEELQKSSEEFTALEREAARLNQENGQLKTTIQDLRKEHKGIKQDYQGLEREREEVEQQREQLRQAEVERLERAVLEQQEWIDEVITSEAVLRQEVEKLERDVLEQQEWIDEVLASEAVLQQELERERRNLERERQSHTDNSKQSKRLRKSQAEVENLEHDVLQQAELIKSLAASEAVLRCKLERARSERAAYRMSAEKLQRDVQLLKKESVEAHKLVHSHGHGHADDEALDTIVRAAESAQARHKKELRGMMIQMEWMQARWEREASLRSDAAYAKKFLQLQLSIANACNKAQLRELEQIRTNLLQSRKPLALPKPLSFSSPNGSSPPTLKSFFIMARFIARMRIAARNWASQEAVRQKLRTAVEEKRRNKRSKQLKVVPVDVF
ncbi:hypothetical protein ACHAQJ_002351 [Trichoderma viride]